MLAKSGHMLGQVSQWWPGRRHVGTGVGNGVVLTMEYEDAGWPDQPHVGTAVGNGVVDMFP